MSKHLSIAILCLSVAILLGAGSVDRVNAQTLANGYTDRSYLSTGWHAIAELTERGIVTGREEWESTYVGRFAYHGCGFAMQYTIIVGTTDLVSVFVDDILIEQFDGTADIPGMSTRWYQTTCGMHDVLVGTRSVANFWITGIDIWDMGS